MLFKENYKITFPVLLGVFSITLLSIDSQQPQVFNPTKASQRLTKPT